MFFTDYAPAKKMCRLKHKKRKRKRIRKPKFIKEYVFTKQDEEGLDKIKILYITYSKIANKILTYIPNRGDWTINIEGLCIYIDPVFGMQAEIQGSSKLPLLKRVIIHIELLKLLEKKCSILKAVRYCIEKLKTL